jgi:putative N-acetylmannosamine-6-phosphate epimerase
MSKNKYMTKYQLEHLKKRVSAEIDPIIEEAKLMRKSVVADLTASAEGKLAKKIKADVVIKDLEKAFKSLETAQRKAKTFFTKGVSADMKNDLKLFF